MSVASVTAAQVARNPGPWRAPHAGDSRIGPAARPSPARSGAATEPWGTGTSLELGTGMGWDWGQEWAGAGLGCAAAAVPSSELMAGQGCGELEDGPAAAALGHRLVWVQGAQQGMGSPEGAVLAQTRLEVSSGP